ncbi:Ig-like domain-containing protein [Roseovarius salinarum]|uniref:Ig-like domain-containing protein n=1 Tax=Roseovarius salinarum TaxID=1981892 RepID=UPI000C3480A1|nr:Ig-like domain-containing protein [Roseovarius salinarum]
MKAIDFVVRAESGASDFGTVPASDNPTVIGVGRGKEISFNIRQSDINGFLRAGSDLEIVLADGRVIVLEDYFGADGAPASRLFISSDGYLNEVTLIQGDDGALYAQYGATAQWGKWSPSEELIFLGGNEVAAAEPEDEETVSMLGMGLLGGNALLGATGAGVASVTAAAALTSNEDGSVPVPAEPGSPPAGVLPDLPEMPAPSVDMDTVVFSGGTNVYVISGQAVPGTTLEVTIGGSTVETVAGSDGTWTADFSGNLPQEGTHTAVVTVIGAGGGTTEIEGPEVVVDFTPPALDVTGGTVRTGEDSATGAFADGLEISGTGEPGATVEVTIGGVSHETQVGPDGDWTVVFEAADLPQDVQTAQMTVVSTDAHGNSATIKEPVAIDTVVEGLAWTGEVGGSDAVVNQAEMQSGLEVTGTAEPGSSVSVQLGDAVTQATVAADGSWTAGFTAGQIAAGTYTTQLIATATDAAGNVRTIEDTVAVDTEAGTLSVQAGQVGGDGTVNADEAASGITVGGRADPGAEVEVTFEGTTRTVTADDDGDWSVEFAAGEIPRGSYDAQLVAITTDAAGNTRRVDKTVNVDTRVEDTGMEDLDVAVSTDGTDVVNKATADAGFEVTGTAEPGSTVGVTIDGVTREAQVDDDGNWTAQFEAGALAEGEYTADMTVEVTDSAGNTKTIEDTVTVDTRVNTLSADAASVATDGTVNAAEARDGITLAGQVEAGSAVQVEIFGKTYDADVDGDGNWTLDIPSGDIPEGESTESFKVTATDAAGNTTSIEDSLTVDTDVPDAPGIVGYFRQGGGYRNVTTETTEETVTVHEIEPDGSVSAVPLHTTQDEFLGESDHHFLDGSGDPTTVPDGSQLVVTSTDDAGNASSTLVVLDETATSEVELDSAALDQFDVSAVDLRFGDNAEMTATEAEVTALSDTSDTLVVHGGADDTVTLAGAQDTGDTQIDGDAYDIYSFGGDATVIVDEDVTVQT